MADEKEVKVTNVSDKDEHRSNLYWTLSYGLRIFDEYRKLGKSVSNSYSNAIIACESMAQDEVELISKMGKPNENS